jgi:glycosyltransferase involved in cell wall biosynthesis
MAIREGVVSTIITVYNRPALVVEAIDSVLSQSHQDIEVLVVDDGSTDDTGDVIRRHAARHPAIRYVHRENGGFARAVNTALPLVTGEFVQFLDSDDVLMPDKFAAQIDGLRAHAECGISYCFAREYPLGGEPPPTPARRTAEQFPELFPAILAGRLWPSPVPLYRRALIDAIGLYREWSIHREWEFECRAAALGTKLHHVPEFLADVRGVHHLEGRIKGDVPAHKLADYVSVLEGVYGHARAARLPAGAFDPFLRRVSNVAQLCEQAGAEAELGRCRELAASIEGRRSAADRAIRFGKRLPRAVYARARDVAPFLRGKRILRRYSTHYAQARRAYHGSAPADGRSTCEIGVRILSDTDRAAISSDYGALVDRVAHSAATAMTQSADRRFFPDAIDPITIELGDPFGLDGLNELCDPLLSSLEQSVYGCHTIADKVYVYRTLASRARPQKSWLWHFDNHPREVLKVMIYLTDVTDDTAPFEYIRDCVTGRPLMGSPLAPTFGTSRLPAGRIDRQLRGGFERVRVTGPRGTIILFDDNIIHRGTIAASGHRDVIVFQVRPALFKASPHIDKRWTGTFGYRQFPLDPNELSPQRTA